MLNAYMFKEENMKQSHRPKGNKTNHGSKNSNTKIHNFQEKKIRKLYRRRQILSVAANDLQLSGTHQCFLVSAWNYPSFCPFLNILLTLISLQNQTIMECPIYSTKEHENTKKTMSRFQHNKNTIPIIQNSKSIIEIHYATPL